ncbi:MAG: pentapeptide repeat-containing protein [Euryarchaeota archaeon]|nr:pentapeptide repeat-containing protein [Euryarchaeota archaeon]
MKRLIPIPCVTLSLTACSGSDSSGGVALSKDPYPTNQEFPDGDCDDDPTFAETNTGCGWIHINERSYYIKPGADLSGANLVRADLSGANLQLANLENANLRRANLSGAILAYTKLRSTNLSRAELRRADLRYADMFNANLMRADLTGAALEHADLYRCKTRETIWPDGTRDPNGYWHCRWY